MGWVKLDDEFTDHPKIDELGDPAFRLHVAGLCYAARKLTDGVVPTSALRRLVPRYKPTQLEELVAAGVWHELGHGCDSCIQPPPGHAVIHDYLEWNRSAEEEHERRRKRSEAGRLGGRRSGAARRTRSEANAEANGEALAEANGKRNRTPSPSPSPLEATPTHDVGTLPPSSSSPRADDDDGAHTLAETWTILAQRDLDRRNAETSARGVEPITAPARQRAWLATAEHRCAEALQPIAQRFLASDPTLEPRQLADLLDNPIATALASSPLGGRP